MLKQRRISTTKSCISGERKKTLKTSCKWTSSLFIYWDILQDLRTLSQRLLKYVNVCNNIWEHREPTCSGPRLVQLTKYQIASARFRAESWWGFQASSATICLAMRWNGNGRSCETHQPRDNFHFPRAARRKDLENYHFNHWVGSLHAQTFHQIEEFSLKTLEVYKLQPTSATVET